MRSGGSTANRNGHILEDALIPCFTRNNYHIYNSYNDFLAAKKDGTLPKKYVVKQVPFTTIYNKKGKTEFVVVNKLSHITVRIECKWQQAAGSVDEKFPYMYLNAVFGYPEDHVIFCVGGNGYKPEALAWLKNACNKKYFYPENCNKCIEVMELSEVIQTINSLR
ncbi:MAG: 4-diphosphocytidyl-2C-methyl-D-erythritol kinase [Bacilli bacterium]|nr:4-diphosphocytidyl-2C-methyl-D-erythritol kinase [Bacilli bacterium]